MTPLVNEKIIVYKIRQGDTDAFGQIYDFYHEKLYRFVYLKLPTAQDAQDITAETFLKAWHYIHDQKHIANVQAFLYQIARNLVVDFYRRRGTAIVESIDDQEIVIADRIDLTLEEKMTLKSDMARVENALRMLKDMYREVIVLHYLNELSLKEVARILGVSTGNVRVIRHRALKALKRMLGEEKES